MRITVAIFALALASCTYAPRSTSIDNNYNARQMAIGVTEQSQDAMTSTTHEEEAIEEGDSNNTPSESTTSQEGDLQENHSSYVSQEQRPAVSTPSFITIGSSKSDVVKVQGTPTAIFDYSSGDRWFYGGSVISFNAKDKIESWINNGNLKVKMQIP
jgi:hypothetical protein